MEEETPQVEQPQKEVTKPMPATYPSGEIAQPIEDLRTRRVYVSNWSGRRDCSD